MENHDINPTEQYDPLGRDEEFEEEFEESLREQWLRRREKEAKCPF